jgi:3-dehydroquinate synthase
MKSIVQRFQVSFEYPVHFTNNLFHAENFLLRDVLQRDGSAGVRRLLVIIDSGVAEHHPQLATAIMRYVEAHKDVLRVFREPWILPGGEAAKNNPELVAQIQEAVNEYGVDRHSYIVAIGGGALLDYVGYAAAVSHRGIRHVRIPTTVLAQNDSGVGVKNGINAFTKKNFLGTFAPPYAVLNDFDFLLTLPDRDWRSGISEAIKVALIKDEPFFTFIEENASLLAKRNMPAMQQLIYHCAQLHLDHIAGGDPFEMGSSRPLDFGHWAAHKLEQLNGYEIRHGEAVAVGIALDCVYSHLAGMLSEPHLNRILTTIEDVGFDLYHPDLGRVDEESGKLAIVKGLMEFREHLGGRLTIMLLERIGKGVEVHHIDPVLVAKAVDWLENYRVRV